MVAAGGHALGPALRLVRARAPHPTRGAACLTRWSSEMTGRRSRWFVASNAGVLSRSGTAPVGGPRSGRYIADERNGDELREWWVQRQAPGGRGRRPTPSRSVPDWGLPGPLGRPHAAHAPRGVDVLHLGRGRRAAALDLGPVPGAAGRDRHEG